jgi:hypothetical protein
MPLTWGFAQVWLDKLSINKLQIRAVVRGWTNIAELLYLTSSKYFQSTAARADGTLIPHLRKALFVGGKHKSTQHLL